MTPKQITEALKVLHTAVHKEMMTQAELGVPDKMRYRRCEILLDLLGVCQKVWG